MKRAVLLLLVACQATEKDYPVGPGGGGGPIGMAPGVVDGGVTDGADGDAGLQLTGKVCLLVDLRDFTRCNDRLARGLRVTLGSRTATTTDNGVFTIAAPRGAGFTWHVESDTVDDIVRTAMPFGTDNTIPVIDFETYRDLLVDNVAAVGPLQGSVVVRVVRGATGVAGVTGAMAGQDIVLYDSNSVDIWNSGTVGTGGFGAVWIPGIELPVPAGALNVRLTPPGGATAVDVPVVIEDETITFVTTDLQ
jgi:hypothetical protein